MPAAALRLRTFTWRWAACELWSGDPPIPKATGAGENASGFHIQHLGVLVIVIAVESQPGKGDIKIEVDDSADSTDLTEIYGDLATRESMVEKVVRASRPLFTEAPELIQSCSEAVTARLATMDDLSPDEVEMQLAVKLDASAGARLVSMSGGAQLQVTLRWRSRDDD